MTENIKPQTEEILSYKCNWCDRIHKREFDAVHCAFKHAKENLANILLKQGNTLEQIEYWCGFRWNLTNEQKKITKDNCFIVSHWQCCEKPVYKITAIDEHGNLRLWGKGSWSGGYGNFIPIDKLPKPYPKEELYVHNN